MGADSEFRAYQYIEKVLASLGWDTRNPRRGGSVYTQHEFYKHDPLLTQALGPKSPENIILIPWDGGLHYWLVEAKATHRQRLDALKKAQSYAVAINRISPNVARFATGIAGTPDESFYVTTTYWDGDDWHEVKINDYTTTGFLTLQQCQDILDKNKPHLALFDDDPARFLKKAHAINKTLHENEIPVKERAHLMAALLLALVENERLRIQSTAKGMIREINGSIEDLLSKDTRAEWIEALKLHPPASEKNHRKYRRALIETLQHLREMNVRSAINAGDDALGKFYETFLKYTNDAREMGIVLTPRHITTLAVNVLGIGSTDRIFDPACGTGGFLIAAMDGVRRRAPNAYEDFTRESLFGIEQSDPVYGLALVNMIFRGDGKSRLYDGNTFDHEFWLRDGHVFYTLPGDQEPEGATRPFTRVLMNPPFKLALSPAIKFVDHGLKQMKPNGLLFAVLPNVVIDGDTHEDWRRELLKRHTLKACVRFDLSLFYPIKESTYGVILQAHRSHKSQDEVFMGFLYDDQHRLRKSKLIAAHEEHDNVEAMTKELRRFMVGQPLTDVKPREQCLTTVDFDGVCSFAPESYLPKGESDVYAALRYLRMETTRKRALLPPRTPVVPVRAMQDFPLDTFYAQQLPALVETLKEYPPGRIPVISATSADNGVAAWLDVPDNLCHSDCLTISLVNNTQPCQAFWHPYQFSALNGLAVVLEPIDALAENELAILYVCEAITVQNAWRYNYARKVQLHELTVTVPVTKNGEPDFQAMAAIVKGQFSHD